MLNNILVVDSDRKTRFDIENILRKMDLNINSIHQAANGREGLEQLKAHSVDLVITDIEMPIMNGLEMLGQIRSDPSFVNVPTIVVSSRRDPKLLNAIHGTGLGYLHKPFSWRELRKKVTNMKTKIADYVQET